MTRGEKKLNQRNLRRRAVTLVFVVAVAFAFVVWGGEWGALISGIIFIGMLAFTVLDYLFSID